MSSILMNYGAMVALQTLNTVNDDMLDTQTSISTGKEVASAKDDAAKWSISKAMESDVAGFEGVEENIALAEATVSVASAGAEMIVEKMVEIKELLVSASAENVDHAKIQDQITNKAEQIDEIINTASFNGVNLLQDDVNGAGANSIDVLISMDRTGPGGAPTATTLTVASAGIEDASGYATTFASLVTDADTARTSLNNFEGTLSGVIDATTALGATAARLEDQSDFVGRLVDAMTQGISAMVDTNMEEASARLNALETQQELAVQSLGIANDAPSALMQLFR